MMLADVRFETIAEAIVARVSGEVDMSNADEIAKAVTHMITNQSLGVVLDLSEVDYFDSAGIHLIYDLRESLRVRGQDLSLVVPPVSAVRDTLRLAAVLNTLEVKETLDDAVAQLGG